jgi:hypothetical protein
MIKLRIYVNQFYFKKIIISNLNHNYQLNQNILLNL